MNRPAFFTGIVVSLALAMPCVTEPAASEGAPRSSNWCALLGFGRAAGLSTHGVSNALRAGGYNDPACVSGGPFSCDKVGPTPYSKQAGSSWDVSLRRRVNPTTWMELVVARDNLGRTTGYRDELPAGGMYLNQTVLSVTCLVGKGREGQSPKLTRPWWSIGPALCRFAIDHETPPSQHTPNNVSAVRPGAVASIGYVLGTGSRRFVPEVMLRCNLVPPVKLGPIRRPLAGTDSAGSLPQTTVNFTHVVILVRLGIRS